MFFSHCRPYRVVHSVVYGLSSWASRGKSSSRTTEKSLCLVKASSIDKDLLPEFLSHAYVHVVVVPSALLSAILRFKMFLLLLSHVMWPTPAFSLYLLLPILTHSFSLSGKAELLHKLFETHPHVFLQALLLKISALFCPESGWSVISY